MSSEDGIVRGYGSLDSKIALVGEQPAKYEVRFGKPFSGPAGDNLNECLQHAKIARSECYLTNVVKDATRPLEFYFRLTTGKYGRCEPTEAGKAYLEVLYDELKSTKANVIVALGNIALWALCNRIGITSWRGSVIESTLLPGRKIIPTVHPAIYTPEKLFKAPKNFLYRYLITHDLKKVKRNSDFPDIRQKDRRILIEPTFTEVMSYLDDCRKYAERGGTLFYDIELTPKTQCLSCISLAIGDDLVMCIPFVDSKGNYFDPEQELDIMLELASLLGNEKYKKGGQNIGFDSHFLLREYGIFTNNKDDTMIAQGILYPEFPRGKALNFITAMWTEDIPYYKADGKLWITGVGEYRKGWNYNGLDSIACADAFPKQLAELEMKGNFQTYERVVRLIEPLTYMMEHGVKIDIEGMRQENIRCREQADILEQEIFRLAGKEFNVHSPQQVADYFYVQKRIKPYRKNGNVTVNVEALKRIASEHKLKEASLILQVRQLRKRESTYLDEDKIDPDGRMRCSYNPVGSKYGRISSSKNIYGTGTNMQNEPPDVLAYFVADEGYVAYTLDLSQVENRIVAYVGNIFEMIDVFQRGLDSHRQTGSLIFRIPYNQVSDEVGSCDYGNGEQSQRDWAKRANHAFNYGFGYKSFALKYEIPESEAKEIYTLYHRVYPGVEKSYWAGIQQQLKKDRTLTNLYGRKVTFLGKWSDSMLNEAYSCIPQGSCGDHINELGVNFVYYNSSPHFRTVELMTQVHDSISFQIPLATSLENHAKVLIDVKRSLETPMRWRQKEFVVPVDLTINYSLHKKSGFNLKSKEISEDIPVLTVQLKNALEKLDAKR